MVRFRRQPVALCSNDAKICYNRIILLIAALAMCKLSTQKTWCQSMIETLAKMKHHIQTAFGKSKTGSGHNDWGEPIAGIGQGNGAGPAIWAAVSTPLFIMQEDGFFAMMVSAISKQQLLLARFAFVDNTDLCLTQEIHKTKLIHNKMQGTVTHWEGLLQASGEV